MYYQMDDAMQSGHRYFAGSSDADRLAREYFRDPVLRREINGMVDEASLMGYDIDDPELMGAWLKNLVKKIKTRIQERKASGKPLPTISVDTGKGTTVVGPEGISYTSVPVASSAAPVAVTTQEKIQEALKKPYVVAALVAVPLLIALTKQKRQLPQQQYQNRGRK